MTNYSIIKEETISSPNNKKHTLVDATVQLPNGKQAVWQYIKTRPVVAIVALDEQNCVYVVRQWRPAYKDFVWELPAGGVEDPNPTDAMVLANANRELQEEIGLKADNLKIIARFTPGVHIDTTWFVVLATQCRPNDLPKDENEELEVKKLTVNEAYKLLIDNQTPPSFNLIGLLLVKREIEKPAKN